MTEDMKNNGTSSSRTQFDFGQIGRRTPYSVPEDFFATMEADVMKAVKTADSETVRGKEKKRTPIVSLWKVSLSAAAVAIILFAVCFETMFQQQPKDEWQDVEESFAELSANDQAFLMDVYQADVFLDD